MIYLNQILGRPCFDIISNHSMELGVIKRYFMGALLTGSWIFFENVHQLNRGFIIRILPM